MNKIIKSYKTATIKAEDIEKKWLVVDAESQTLGRLSSRIAFYLIGKHKPQYSPHVECGDHIILINASKIRMTGKKMINKQVITYSGYPGGQKFTTPAKIMANKPDLLLENAVRRMLPRNIIGREMFRHLHIFQGETHTFQAQKPVTVKL